MNKKQSILQKSRRLLCFLCTLCFLAVNMHARPQAEVRITLNLDGVTLAEAIKSIEEQSRFIFFNNGADITKTVSISVKDESIGKVCEALFTPAGVAYTIEGYNIIISAKKKSETAITGVVLDATGAPVPGAAVMEQGTSNGTTTGMDGKFSLTVIGGGHFNDRSELSRL